jgi:hypothetical protein
MMLWTNKIISTGTNQGGNLNDVVDEEPGIPLPPLEEKPRWDPYSMNTTANPTQGRAALIMFEVQGRAMWNNV